MTFNFGKRYISQFYEKCFAQVAHEKQHNLIMANGCLCQKRTVVGKQVCLSTIAKILICISLCENEFTRYIWLNLDGLLVGENTYGGSICQYSITYLLLKIKRIVNDKHYTE